MRSSRCCVLLKEPFHSESLRSSAHLHPLLSIRGSGALSCKVPIADQQKRRQKGEAISKAPLESFEVDCALCVTVGNCEVSLTIHTLCHCRGLFWRKCLGWPMCTRIGSTQVFKGKLGVSVSQAESSKENTTQTQTVKHLSSALSGV